MTGNATQSGSGRFEGCRTNLEEGIMLKDRTAEALRNRATSLRIAALRAEDICVKERMCEHANDFERLVDMIKPVLSAEDKHAEQ